MRTTPGFGLPVHRAGEPPTLLKITMVAIMVLPAYMVVGPVGASGSVGHLLALAVISFWVASVAFGLHDPLAFGHPGRAMMLFWVMASCASYVALFAGFSGGSDSVQRAAADRWLLLVFAGAGITLVTTETARSLQGLRSIVRWVMAGAVFCCVVAAVQFILKVDPMTWVSSIMVGFQNNGSGTIFQGRGSFSRVAGSTMHPIELGVICSMLLPLSLWWAIYDTWARRLFRIGAPVLLFTGNIMTVSRTGMIGLAVAALIVIPFLPRTAKQWAIVVVPFGFTALFLMVPGMVSTLFTSATAGSSDTSITYRTDDYPLAWRLFFDHPLLGLGPGAWLPIDPKNNFDNQYLLTVVTLGCVGLVAFLLYLLVPAFSALMAARRVNSAELRLLGGSVAAAMFVAAVSAGTFDAMSFQTFALICPFFVGLGGAVWLMAKEHPSYSILSVSTYPRSFNLLGSTQWIR